MGDSTGTAQALAGSAGVHPAHGALYRQNHGAGQELRAPDHCEEDLYQVSAALTGLGLHLVCMLRFKHCLLFWHSELSLDTFVDQVTQSLYMIVSYIFGCVSFPQRGRKCKPIFVQIARQVVKLNASDLRLPSRAWKVKLVGEGADDAGGVFDDTITEMCQVHL